MKLAPIPNLTRFHGAALVTVTILFLAGGCAGGVTTGPATGGLGNHAGADSGGSHPGGGEPLGGTSSQATTSAPHSGGVTGTTSATSTGLVWRKANLTHYTSYPDPNSEECIVYNGCMWAGQFAALDGVQPESWVAANNIAAVHSKDFSTYRLKTLRLKQGAREIDVKVYDMCADSDCSGCCTQNSAATGFLIDIESYTMKRFGSGDGIVDWTCLDC